MRERMTARRALRGAARRVPRAPFRLLLPAWLLRGPVRFWLSVVAADPDRRRALRELLALEQATRLALDQAAIAYDGGVHVKHRLTRYHDFFVDRVRPGERVLDVGSGKGELAHDLATRAGATVVGIDNDPQHLAFARSRFRHERLEFLEGDVLERLPEGGFDVVVLSNVLEHVDDRVGLLRRLVESATPKRLLLRVPVYARDWLVPLREELGLPYFSDPGHLVEYDEQALRAELAEAGLRATELLQVWGEIWATAEPAHGF
jgi:SAM-dependent methyltransferase